MARPQPELTGEPIDPSAVVVGITRASRAPESLPPSGVVDTLAVAEEVAEEFVAERLQVRVETTPGDPRVQGYAGDLRRVLRWMIDRSSAIDGGEPWVTLKLVITDDAVAYELRWFGTPGAATAESESALFDEAVAELGATFQVSGLRARLELPRVWPGAVPVVSGLRPRAFEEPRLDARTDPPPKP